MFCTLLKYKTYQFFLDNPFKYYVKGTLKLIYSILDHGRIFYIIYNIDLTFVKDIIVV